MATLSGILAWKIPGTEESGRLQSMGSQRARNDWVTNKSALHCQNLRPRWNCNCEAAWDMAASFPGLRSAGEWTGQSPLREVWHQKKKNTCELNPWKLDAFLSCSPLQRAYYKLAIRTHQLLLHKTLHVGLFFHFLLPVSLTKFPSYFDLDNCKSFQTNLSICKFITISHFVQYFYMDL